MKENQHGQQICSASRPSFAFCGSRLYILFLATRPHPHKNAAWLAIACCVGFEASLGGLN